MGELKDSTTCCHDLFWRFWPGWGQTCEAHWRCMNPMSHTKSWATSKEYQGWDTSSSQKQFHVLLGRSAWGYKYDQCNCWSSLQSWARLLQSSWPCRGQRHPKAVNHHNFDVVYKVSNRSRTRPDSKFIAKTRLHYRFLVTSKAGPDDAHLGSLTLEQSLGIERLSVSDSVDTNIGSSCKFLFQLRDTTSVLRSKEARCLSENNGIPRLIQWKVMRVSLHKGLYHFTAEGTNLGQAVTEHL